MALACPLFGYVAARAALIPITWDEAYNYLEFTRKGTLLPFGHFREGGRSRDCLASLGFAVLAVAAHLTLIHFLLALLAVFVLAGPLLAPPGLGTPGRALYALRTHTLALVLVGISLVPVAFVVRNLRQAHAFFYGGTTGFWQDTLVGSANAWLYQERRPGISAEYLAALVVLLMAVAVVAAVQSIRRRSNTRDLYLPALVFLVTTCALASVVQHHVLGVLYLSSRTATHLVILVAWILVVLAAERSRASRSWRLALPLVAAAVVLNLIGSLNLSSVLRGPVDVDDLQMRWLRAVWTPPASSAASRSR